MRLFKTKAFARFARSERILDAYLVDAIERAERGLIDADLGGCLIKQRLARQGQGRSGGYRAMIAYRAVDVAFFLYGFAKNDRDNIEPDELKTLRDIAVMWLQKNPQQIARYLLESEITEVTYGSTKTKQTD